MILIVEDNPFMQTVAKKIIEKFGYNSHISATGAEAIEMATTEKYDAILLDCQLPIISGYEVAREIRSREARKNNGERVVIIACTANMMEGDREECLKAGMDDHTTKPIDEIKLKSILKKWIG